MFIMHDGNEDEDNPSTTVPGDEELPDDIGARVGETHPDDSQM